MITFTGFSFAMIFFSLVLMYARPKLRWTVVINTCTVLSIINPSLLSILRPSEHELVFFFKCKLKKKYNMLY